MSTPRTHDQPGPDGRPDEAAREFADQLAAMLDAAGFPRMPARTLMALLTSPTGKMTAEQLSATLEVSPAAVSGAVKYLQSVQVIRTGSLPGTRRRSYALAPSWYAVTLTRLSRYADLAEFARRRPASLGPGTAAGERIQEMADFYTFLGTRFPQLLNEWTEIRADLPRE